ncbi:MAG: hypothetical protein ACRDIU_02360 [Actinomycetota bacterium]
MDFGIADFTDSSPVRTARKKLRVRLILPFSLVLRQSAIVSRHGLSNPLGTIREMV